MNWLILARVISIVSLLTLLAYCAATWLGLITKYEFMDGLWFSYSAMLLSAEACRKFEEQP